MRPIYNKSLDLDKVIVILCERLIITKGHRLREQTKEFHVRYATAALE